MKSVPGAPATRFGTPSGSEGRKEINRRGAETQRDLWGDEIEIRVVWVLQPGDSDTKSPEGATEDSLGWSRRRNPRYARLFSSSRFSGGRISARSSSDGQEINQPQSRRRAQRYQGQGTNAKVAKDAEEEISVSSSSRPSPVRDGRILAPVFRPGASDPQFHI